MNYTYATKSSNTPSFEFTCKRANCSYQRYIFFDQMPPSECPYCHYPFLKQTVISVKPEEAYNHTLWRRANIERLTKIDIQEIRTAEV